MPVMLGVPQNKIKYDTIKSLDNYDSGKMADFWQEIYPQIS